MAGTGTVDSLSRGIMPGNKHDVRRRLLTIPIINNLDMNAADFIDSLLRSFVVEHMNI